MRSIPGQGNALETEPSFDDAACCPFESFYRANRNEKQPDYQYHCAYLPVLGICCTFDIKSDMRMVLALLTSLRSFSSFWHGIARKRSLLVLRASVDIKSTEKSATMSRVFCTFFPQKVPIAVFDWRVFCRFLVGKKRRKNRPADKKG